VAYVVQFSLMLPVIVTVVWSWHRYSAPLLLDSLDADEMVVGGVHKLTTATYALLAVGFAASLDPDEHELTSSVLRHWAAFVLCLGIAQAVMLRSLLRRRRKREAATFSPRVWGPQPMPAPPFIPPSWAAPPPPWAAGAPGAGPEAATRRH
jgi:hypothetical protein